MNVPAFCDFEGCSCIFVGGVIDWPSPLVLCATLSWLAWGTVSCICAASFSSCWTRSRSCSSLLWHKFHLCSSCGSSWSPRIL